MIDIPLDVEPETNLPRAQSEQGSDLTVKPRDHHVSIEDNDIVVTQAQAIIEEIFILTHEIDLGIKAGKVSSEVLTPQFVDDLEKLQIELKPYIKALEKTAQFKAEQREVPQTPDPEKHDDGRRLVQIEKDRKEKEARAEAERTNWPLTSYFWFFNEIVSSIRDFQSNLHHHSFTQKQAIEAFILRTQKNELKFIELFGDENHPTNELSNQ